MSETPERKLIDHDAYGTAAGGRFSKVWELPDGTLEELTTEEARQHIPWEVREPDPSLVDEGPESTGKTYGEV